MPSGTIEALVTEIRPFTNFFPPFVYLTQDQDDAAIVSQCLAGKTERFEVLVARYERVLFTVALRMLGNRDDALDAAQNAFVKAFERLASYRPEYRFFSWVYRILTNECLNVLRARRPDSPLPEGVSLAGPLDAMEVAERKAAVQAALLQLSADYREVVVLRHFGELSYEEIASTLGIPEKTVKSRLHTARQKLSGQLQAWSQTR
jgi:RNA polymerase sigma-70 factor, ECF subfamily